LWQLFSSLFIHDPHSVWHLAFNMLFLWIFGAPVESRLGRVSFLSLYLLGGAVANIAHMMVSKAPVIGASGAIAGLTGAFLALYPRSRVIVLFLFTMSFISVPRPGPISASVTGSGQPNACQALNTHTPISSPNNWLISGAVVKSPAAPNGSRVV
jgi:membrane associated rhomboid family serine protease